MENRKRKTGDSVKTRITLSEFYKELSKFTPTTKSKYFTEEQKNMMIRARKAGMSYELIAQYYERLGWGYIGRTTVRNFLKQFEPFENEESVLEPKKVIG
jgi:hypothetical protein